MRQRETRFIGAAALAFAACALLAAPAAAGLVTRDDDNPLAPVDGMLRYEINMAAPGEVIEFDATLDPDPVLSEYVPIDKDLTIEGLGADATTIDGINQIFRVDSLSPISVTIRDLTLTGGDAQDGGAGTGDPGDPGGAIYNTEELTVDGVAFVNNKAGSGGSGANGMVGNPGMAGGLGGYGEGGGALFNTVGGEVTITGSTFEGNFAGDGGAGGNGGNGTGMVPIAGAGGDGNVGGDGGAISNAGALTVSNSTFFGNRSGKGGMGGDRGGGLGAATAGTGGDGGDGGAIRQAGAGSIALINVTIAGNVAEQGGAGGSGIVTAPGGSDGSGGGTSFFVAATADNSIWSQNEGDFRPNCSGGGMISGANNIDFPDAGCPPSFSNGNPQLDPLADNGGGTETMALGAGSAALNQILPGAPNCPGIDQRGVPRPQSGLCDIGAFEVVCTVPSALAGCPPLPLATIPPTTPVATPAAARKKCKKGRKLKKGKCRKKKRKK